MNRDRVILYETHLSNILGISFTAREMDVISCILHSRANKKIALLLSISYRTVDAHVYRIISKINKNSKDDIIDFVERSGKSEYIRQYYLLILIDGAFRLALSKIEEALGKNQVVCSLWDYKCVESSYTEQNESKSELSYIKRLLNSINISLDLNISFMSGCYILRHAGYDSKEIYLLLDNKSPLFGTSSVVKYIDLTRTGRDHYLEVFSLLRWIFNDDRVERIYEDFIRDYDNIGSTISNRSDIPSKVSRSLNKRAILFGTAVIFTIFGIIFYSLQRYSSYSSALQNTYKEEEFVKVRSRISVAASHYTTSHVTTEDTRKNHANILSLQQDVDYLYKYRDYLELDELLQSQFAYLSNVLVSYYRVNRNLASPAIEKYLGVEYKECQRFQDHEQDKMYQCVASKILDRVLEYYGKRYKFNTEDDIATITGKLEREPYAINDFILLSYNLARSYFYFPMNLLDDKDKLRIGNKYIDFILSNEHLYPQSFKSFIFYLSKKYQKIFEYDENIVPLKQLETRLKNEFDLITEKDLVSVINKIKSVPQSIRKLEEILLAVKPEIALRYGTLKNIVATLDIMLNDNNEYINSYRPWKNYDQDPTGDIIVPKNSIFTVGVLKFEKILVRASMASCNAVIHYKDPIKLVRANKPILLESLKDLEKFILMDGMQDSWSDIGVKYVRKRTAQSLSILQESIHMESSDNDILSQKLEAIANKISDNRFDDTIIADIRNLIMLLSGN